MPPSTNMSIFDWINFAILLALGLSTLIGILDFIGFLPRKLRNRFRLNRAEDTISVLEELGIDIEQYRRKNQVLQYPRTMTDSEIAAAAQDALDTYKIDAKVTVGQHRKTALPYYYDLIGASCSAQAAKYFAGILSTFWAASLEKADCIKESHFDFIVTPKGGSPILGYEFAAMINKPFVLHEEKERFKLDGDMRSCFDCAVVPERGQTALIVDDSTTGGAMVCNAVSDLRRFGYKVHTCLVVFEPKSKDARGRLAQNNVQLVSILQTHTGN